MRSRDGSYPAGRRGSAARQITAQCGCELGGVLGIACAGVSGRPRGSAGKSTLSLLLPAEEIVVFEKPGPAERVDQVLLETSHLQITGQAD